jgi:exopolyphosphatase/guanosine-5'-triphosphate,3'-diphosphate pyrophosphatase
MSEKRLQPDAMERALAVLSGFASEISELGLEVSQAKVLATSAFRNAINGAAFVEAIKEHTGLNVDIISGEAEAGYIFNGVRASGVLAQAEKSLVVDIGGGSVEFILCSGETALWKRSFEIGGLRLMDAFHTRDPLPEASVSELEKFLETRLAPLWEVLEPHLPLDLVGCSGSFDTLVEMREAANGQPVGNVEEQPWHSLRLPEFSALTEKLLPLPLNERLAIPGMISLRAGMMPVAMVLIRLLLQKIGAGRILVSTWSLKEGVLFSENP